MDCDNVRLLLDDYIDGELSDADARAIEEHAENCAACAEEIREAKILRDALAHMDDDLTVPLEVQAGWRAAVRAEAARKKRKTWMRAVYAVAAALVLVLGTTLVTGGEDRLAEPAEKTMITVNMVEKDGAEMPGGSGNYDILKKYGCADFDRACATIEALAEEYQASVTCDAGGEETLGAREAGYRIELPADYAADFLNAASRLGNELASETAEVQGETAVIYVQIHEQDAE